ncbi:hypothetical protein K432DRAFT_430544 [Lepidopterella palustris CBS 459.81]|uniref:Zn(2)-C6 fungal-type domain-containing protein n=1 Tax=Lepidopterella palustris CBS 459.81 TaxID=1314670 RepID=A0A8E2DXN4_9PEZI|nr:hypothetical protein K432DRAFT_430544 [Lepidopterella palustris CBS 459.81]
MPLLALLARSVRSARSQTTFQTMDLAGGVRSTKPRLSCLKCAQRKVRCDKLNPCTNCLHAGVTCVPVERQRLPRGRHRATASSASSSTAVDSDVRDRLARLEILVRALVPDSSIINASSGATPLSASAQSLSGWNQPSLEERPDKTGLTSNKSPSAGSSSRDDTTATGPYLGNPFWNDLVQETRGLREILQQAEDDDEDGGRMGKAADAHTQLLGLMGHSARPASFVESLEESATPQIREQLGQIFLLQVDPVFKILHRPSLAAHLVHGERYLNYERDHPTVEALDYAIYYAATISLTDEQCMSMFGANKSVIMAKYRLASEGALAHTDFVMTDDLTVLQAFVLYLIATRSQDGSRRVWTMLSLAARIAQGLFLHTEHPSFPVMRPFERELRRRLWYGVGLLDTQAALERASEPMLPGAWLQASNLPMNIDDAQVWFDFDGELMQSDGFTDMTFTIMTCKAQCIGRLLNFPPLSGPAVSDWYVRQEYVHNFQRTIFSLLQRRNPDETASTPFYWYTKQVAECLTATMQLVAVRPLRQQPCQSPPQVKGSGSLLKLAVKVIQKTQALIQDPRSMPWRWFEGIFAPWHALAVALAEICVCDDVVLLESCWRPVELAFARISRLVGESNRATIWGPMEKLMKQAQVKTKSNITSYGGSSSSSSINNNNNNNNNNPYPYDVGFSPSDHSILANLQLVDVRLTPLPVFSVGCGDQTSTPGLPSEGLDIWPDLGEAMDLLGTTSTSLADTAAWANWENFVNELHVGGDSIFSFD